jgi:hypothetical protein
MKVKAHDRAADEAEHDPDPAQEKVQLAGRVHFRATTLVWPGASLLIDKTRREHRLNQSRNL